MNAAPEIPASMAVWMFFWIWRPVIDPPSAGRISTLEQVGRSLNG